MNPIDITTEQKVIDLTAKVEILMTEIENLKSVNTIPLSIYQAFNARLFNAPVIAGNFGVNGNFFGLGDKVIFIANANVAPTINPIGGGILYVTGGALTYLGSGGTSTTIANA